MYQHIVVVMAPAASAEIAEELRGLVDDVVTDSSNTHTRSLAIKQALEADADTIQYCDLDRLIRWVETRPDELRETVAAIDGQDVVIIGRTEQAFNTHPHALKDTETAINALFSHLAGVKVDIGSGSKSFSRKAAQVIMEHGQSDYAPTTDAEWLALCYHAGFEISTVWVDGLDWESADQFRESAADAATQKAAADAYDQRTESWQFRVNMMTRIIQGGLDIWDKHKSKK